MSLELSSSATQAGGPVRQHYACLVPSPHSGTLVTDTAKMFQIYFSWLAFLAEAVDVLVLVDDVAVGAVVSATAAFAVFAATATAIAVFAANATAVAVAAAVVLGDVVAATAAAAIAADGDLAAAATAVAVLLLPPLLMMVTKLLL